jgi:hypothetical protein
VLSDLQANLNYAINGIPLPPSDVSSAERLITGNSRQRRDSGNNYGISVTSDSLSVTVKKDGMNIAGNARISGNLGLAEISNGSAAIDTSKTDSMFEITGIVRFGALTDALGVQGEPPFTITSAGWYPDTLRLNATGLTINASGLGECFINGGAPKALDGAINVQYALPFSEEPYREQISSLLGDVALDCDTIEFVCVADRDQSGVKVRNSADSARYVKFTGDGVVIPIADVDELSLFGSELGGEISGTATITDRQIRLSLDVDGHLDNIFYGIKHDGKANFTVSLARNASAESAVPVSIAYEGKTLSYDAAASGGIRPQDGFAAYAEDNEQ